MDSIVKSATADTVAAMDAHIGLVGLHNTDESTFRTFFLVAAMTKNPTLECDAEWKRFDLLIRHGSRYGVVEFKYYLSKPRRLLNGKQRGFKGGAGPRNKDEFLRCVQKLRHDCDSAIRDRFVVLAYERTTPKGAPASYEDSYGGLCKSDDITDVFRAEGHSLRCVVLTIA